ncbi:adenylate/guanylate cyclase domain-containing protein [Paenibacillus sp. PL2-23]|uniref:CHASE2 domain-containing protein n=1 Tax=Paenibacillus sp. PL2-23 TaxID=2100729 RepID=UPI0030F5DAAF
MRIKLGAIIAILTALAVFLMYRGSLDTVDYVIQDRLMQQESELDTRIVIIGIDDASIMELGAWPWSRAAHAALVDTLTEGKPSVIAFDVTFPAPMDADADTAFADALARAGNVVLPVIGTFPPSVDRGTIQAQELQEPFPELKASAAALGHINTIPDRDRVVRKSLQSFQYGDASYDSFAWTIYRLHQQHVGEGVNADMLPLDDFGRFHIDYAGRPGGFEEIPYSAVINGDVPADYFENRIVLVGPYATAFNDSHLTPMAAKTEMYGIEIHANIIQALLDERMKREWAWPWNALVLALAAGLAYVLLRKLRMSFALLSVVAMAAVLLLAGRYAYAQGQLISTGYTVLLLAACCLVAVIYRYVEELLERRRVTDVFGRYVAPQVVDEILKSGDEGLKLGGTRRELTVLFVDIRGFTPLSEKAQPEEVVDILNQYLDLAATCIFEYGGTLDKFIGDAAMAIYNAPLPLEDHAMKAVETAWAMKAASGELARKLTEKYGLSVAFGIGIHRGPAVFGNIGSKTRMDYTAIGDTVNTAARLESISKPGQIVISEAVYEAVKDRVKATSLGEVKVKGKEQGIAIYELEGLQ